MISVILKTCFIYITSILYTDAIKELRDKILLYSKRTQLTRTEYDQAIGQVGYIFHKKLNNFEWMKGEVTKNTTTKLAVPNGENLIDTVFVKYENGSKEEVQMKDLKTWVQLYDIHYLESPERINRYNLPFEDMMTPSMEAAAEYIWKYFPSMIFQGSKKVYPVSTYPMDNGKLDLQCEIRNWQETIGNKKSTYNIVDHPQLLMKTIKGLRPGQYTNDICLEAFAYFFNMQQSIKRKKCNTFQSSVMFGPALSESLYKSVQVRAMRKWFCIKINGIKNRYETKMDLFTNVKALFFPLNLGNMHWVLLEVNPTNLKQIYYNSLLQEMNEKALAFSKKVHDFLLYYYESSYWKKHPFNSPWSRNLVCDDCTVIGNAKQTPGGNDCGLHVCVLPVLRQANIPVSILGVEPDIVSRELRVRMTLLLTNGKFNFEPDPEMVRGA